jgi:hypothetical protein
MEKKYVRSSDRKFHLVYKTTCLITGRYYIGLHSTDKIDDKYLGSGKRLRRSVIKHGIEAHKRETLLEFNSRTEASEYEKLLITKEMLIDPMCLNCGPGGLGATDRSATKEETRIKLSEASKKYVRTKEWYEKVVTTRKAGDGYAKSDEEKEKIRITLTGKKLTDEHKKKISEGGMGLKRTKETCDNISEALKGKMLGVPKPTFSEEHKENIKLARIGMNHSEEAKANMRKSKSMKANMRACTVDGINIYESVKAMVISLGSGKNSRRSPNFRYVN